MVAKWSIAPERNMKEYGHPAMFPEQLVERCLSCSVINDVVLDLFNGAGTTTVVAKRLSEGTWALTYQGNTGDTALKRLEAETEQLRLF